MYISLSASFFSLNVFAGDCFPKPSPDFLIYIEKVKIIIFLSALIILFLINSLLISLIFKRLHISIIKKRLIIFNFLITLFSFIFYGVVYWLVLPNMSLLKMNPEYYEYRHLELSHIETFFRLIFLNPLNIFSFILSYLSSYFLLKKFVRVINNKNKKIASLLISIVMLPIFGVPIIIFLSKIHYQLFPFIEQKWLPCR